MSDRNRNIELDCAPSKSVLHLSVYPETIIVVQESTKRIWVRQDLLSGLEDEIDKWILVSDNHKSVITIA